MMRFRAASALLLVPAVLLVAAPSASAHPLGNLSVNTYDGVVVSMDGVRIDHVEDVAEVPAVAALQDADADRDGDVSPAELGTWAGAAAPPLQGGSASRPEGHRSPSRSARRLPRPQRARRVSRRCASSAI